MRLWSADLFFRAKVTDWVQGAGGRVVADGPASLAVVELTGEPALERIRALTAAGRRVLAFGPHVGAPALRAARAAGARAVPNAELERALREELSG